MHTLSRLLVVTVATLLVAAAAPAGAALFTPPIHFAPADGSGTAIDKLSLTLSLSTEEAADGSTTLTYDLTLNSDKTSDEWEVVDFAIIRDWSEGSASALDMPLGWTGTFSNHFIDWTDDDPAALKEGETKSFGYTVASGETSSQLFVYSVTKNGGSAFPVISSDAITMSSSQAVVPDSQVVVPEPTAIALVSIAVLGLWRRRLA